MCKETKNFIFLGDVIDFIDFDEVEIYEGFNLKKANKIQKDIINDMLKQSSNQFLRYKYSKDTDYSIIEISNYKDKEDFNNIEFVKKGLYLSKKRLASIFDIIFVDDGSGMKPGKLLNENIYNNFSSELKIGNTKKLELSDVKEIKNLIKKMIAIDFEEYPVLEMAIDDFYNTQKISKKLHFKYFSFMVILELMLLEGGDKSKQLQNKINFVNDCFDMSIDYINHFKIKSSDVSLKTIIKNLYDYRSDIAHGRDIDFENSLQLIKDKEKSIEFLENLTTEIIYQYIDKPKLFRELKSYKIEKNK